MKRTINDLPRSGISLLEVMFAAGILTVGILGMAALVPLGAYELIEAQKLDQSSTAGRAAFRDLEVRGYLQPKLWVDTQMGMLIDPDPNSSTYNQRIMAYPYLPLGCKQYFPPQSYSGTPPVTWTTFAIPDLTANPQLGPLFPTETQRSGLTFRSRCRATPVPPWPAVASLSPPNPPPSFTASEGQVFVFRSARRRDGGAGLGSGSAPAWGDSNISLSANLPARRTAAAADHDAARVATVAEEWRAMVGCAGNPSAELAASRRHRCPGVPLESAIGSVAPCASALLAECVALSHPRQLSQLHHAIDRAHHAADNRRPHFRSRDDLIFNPQDLTNPLSDRPTLGFSYDQLTPPNGPNRLEPSYQGSYSWFATVAPSSAQVDSTPEDLLDSVNNPDASALYNARQFNVSVVVCQNRIPDMPVNLRTDTTPGEWQVPAKVNPGSLGGGEVTLYANNGTQAAWMATLKPGQWLMLSGITVSGEVRHDPTITTTFYYWPRFRTITNWYRIVATDAIDDPLSPPLLRNLTLNGPDCRRGFSGTIPHLMARATLRLSQFGATPPPQGVQFVNLNTVNVGAGPVYIYAYATVVEGVVGVYQKTITIDGDSPFASQ